MTRLVNGISLSYEQVAENLAQMADFAEANPNVMAVRKTYQNRRSIYEYFADLPSHTLPSMMATMRITPIIKHSAIGFHIWVVAILTTA